MKKTATLLGIVAVLSVAPTIAQTTTVDFDDVDLWVAGTNAVTSYGTSHVYAESGWTFTGGPALRNTTTAQDGFPGALGTYSWRLTNGVGDWTATYTLALGAGENFSIFGFDARRWDGTPSPAYTVSYSFDGGSSYTTATDIGTSGVLDNVAFGNSSDWSSFSQTISSPVELAADQFVVRVQSTGTTERIMIDNFTATVVPEPSTYALLALSGLALAGYAARRRQRQK